MTVTREEALEIFARRRATRAYDPDRRWASKQTYIALGNMMTGAAMLGIDSCPIEGMNYEAVNELLVSAGLFDPEEYGVSVAVTFGYRAREIAPKSRRSIEDLVTWV